MKSTIKSIYLCKDHYSPHMETITSPQISEVCGVLGCENKAVKKVLLDIDQWGLAKATYNTDQKCVQ